MQFQGQFLGRAMYRYSLQPHARAGRGWEYKRNLSLPHSTTGSAVGESLSASFHDGFCSRGLSLPSAAG